MTKSRLSVPCMLAFLATTSQTTAANQSVRRRQSVEYDRRGPRRQRDLQSAPSNLLVSCWTRCYVKLSFGLVHFLYAHTTNTPTASPRGRPKITHQHYHAPPTNNSLHSTSKPTVMAVKPRGRCNINHPRAENTLVTVHPRECSMEI
jgi:hypothetical protein